MPENAKKVAQFGAGTWEDAQFVKIRSGLAKYQEFSPTLLTGPKWPSRGGLKLRGKPLAEVTTPRNKSTQHTAGKTNANLFYPFCPRYLLRPTKELMTWTEDFFAQSLHR